MMYQVESLEKFVVRTWYTVEADSPEEAERQVRSGEIGYETKEMEDDPGEYLETVSITDLDSLDDVEECEDDDDGDW